jgi:two-component system, sensor histidine kinase and response regulator
MTEHSGIGTLGVADAARLDATAGSPEAEVRDLDRRDAEALAQARLRDTEQWYRSILESAPDGMPVVDSKGIIHIANRGMEDIFGYAPEALVGQSVEMLLPPEVASSHAGFVRMFFSAPRARAMGAGAGRLEGMHADGRRIPLEVSLGPLPAVAGRT